jgi:UDP-N-acetyl-D-mannosaminuronic acid dehydrogenase
MGLAFKPDIGDLRESPAVLIARQVSSLGLGRLLAVEPNIEKLPDELDKFELVSQEYAYEAADIYIALVKHREFLSAPPPAGLCIDSIGLWA